MHVMTMMKAHNRNCPQSYIDSGPPLGRDQNALRWHHSYVHCSCGTQYQWSVFSVEGESYVLTPYDIITRAVDPPHIR